MPPLRIIFMGTPALACASLAALLRTPEIAVSAVVTQPDRPRGRDLKLHASPVKELAVQHALPVWQPLKAREPALLAQVQSHAPDIIVVAAFGQILPPSLLAVPRLGCVNVHTSLLPRYRGAAPIQWAILNGDTETGVTIMRMDAGLDTGDILTQRRTPILPEDDSQSLHDRLAVLGAELLVETLPRYAAGEIQPVPQSADEASYAPKLKKEDGLMRWEQSATALWNRLRAFTPWPGAFTHVSSGGKRQLLKIWKATVEPGTTATPGTVLQADKHGLLVACGEGALRVTELQSEGRRRLTAAEFLSGHPLAIGERLG